jgi:hypothetical protein
VARDWAFRRGLVWLEVAGGRLFLADEDPPALASLLWVDGLRWLDASARTVARLADWPHLPNLATLDLTYNRLDDAAARLLADSPHLGGLRVLDLAGNLIGDGGALALAASPRFPRLSRLSLRHNRLEGPGIEALKRRFGQGVTL